MSRRILVAAFREEQDLRNAVSEVRARGAKIVDVYSPYAIHGLDEALGWRPSRLTWACGLCGAAGALFMLWFQFWTNSVDWPLNVGGKPLNSLPAFVPVIFEAMVLCGAIGTVLAFFIVSRLRPGKPAELIRPQVTDDRFALVIEQTDATFDARAFTTLLEKCHGEQIEEEVIDRAPRREPEDAGNRPVLRWVNIALAAVFVLLVLAVIWGPQRGERPNVEFLPTMRRSIPLDPQAGGPGLPSAQPLPGVIARDAQPLDYQATEDDAKRAAEKLTSPFAADDVAAQDRGREVYFNFCAACHGSAGDGDGPIALRGYPPPPPLSAEKSRLLKDGELFHVISYGRNNMPPHRKQLSQADRWRALLYVRELQRRAVEKAEQAAAQAAAAKEEAPVEEDSPAEEETSSEEDAPVEEDAPAEEEAPTDVTDGDSPDETVPKSLE